MSLNKKNLEQYKDRIFYSRARILCENGFYGALMSHIHFGVDSNITTVGTNGSTVFFAPDFLDMISDMELDYVITHEVMHIVLNHCNRIGNRMRELYDEACDIVVNSNILYSANMDYNSITLNNFGGIQPHQAPDGSEGYEYSVEEMYELLSTITVRGSARNPDSSGNSNKSGISGQSSGTSSQSSPELADSGHNGSSTGKTPDTSSKSMENPDCMSGIEFPGDSSGNWDNHSNWTGADGGDTDTGNQAEILSEAVDSYFESGKKGSIPCFAERLILQRKNSKLDWRTLLSDFIHEDVMDYTFSPPDRRQDDNPFFLPDFNSNEYEVSNILLMVDTSGSMTDSMIADVYGEIKAIVQQYDGKIKGHIGFFDAAVTEAVSFDDEESLLSAHPVGKGGTDFYALFRYLNQFCREQQPSGVIIFTDGLAEFPKSDFSYTVPLIWLINNKSITPPWGKVARIISERTDM